MSNPLEKFLMMSSYELGIGAFVSSALLLYLSIVLGIPSITIISALVLAGTTGVSLLFYLDIILSLLMNKTPSAFIFAVLAAGQILCAIATITSYVLLISNALGV